MKQTLSVFICLILALFCFGCTTAKEPSAPQEEAAEISSAAAPIVDAECPLPEFLSSQQQTLYRKAQTAFLEFNLSNTGFGSTSNTTKEIDGWQYYACNGTFSQWIPFEKAMTAVFTPEYFTQLNEIRYTDENGKEKISYHFAESDGNLYYSGGGRGGNACFIGPETFELIEETENKIRFYVVGTYGDHVQQSDGTWKVENKYQEKQEIVMVKGEDGCWRFQQFALAN